MPRGLIECRQAYELLRKLLFEYAELFASVDVEIFAVEMEIGPSSTDSSDPALWDEFAKACPKRVSLPELFDAAANYVEKELVVLRHVHVAKQVAEDFRAARIAVVNVPLPLRDYLSVTAE